LLSFEVLSENFHALGELLLLSGAEGDRDSAQGVVKKLTGNGGIRAVYLFIYHLLGKFFEAFVDGLGLGERTPPPATPATLRPEALALLDVLGVVYPAPPLTRHRYCLTGFAGWLYKATRWH
jgi:hypothetical protein